MNAASTHWAARNVHDSIAGRFARIEKRGGRGCQARARLYYAAANGEAMRAEVDEARAVDMPKSGRSIPPYVRTTWGTR